jgi:guanylate kinase
VWLAPPSPEALAERLRQRGVEDPEELQMRLKQV